MEEFGNFRLLSEVGLSEKCHTFYASQISLDREVLLKIFRTKASSSRQLVSLLTEETRKLFRLSGAGFPKMFDAGPEKGRFYIARQYIEGTSLKNLILARKKIGFEEALFIIKELINPIGIAHQQDIIHGNIHPANVIIDGSGIPVLIDYGVIASTYVASKISGTLSSGDVGFVPPELEENSEVGTRGDIYSLGVLLFHMITGIFPGTLSNSPRDVCWFLLQSLPDMELQNPEISPWVWLIIQKCIMLNPNERYPGVDDFYSDIERGLSGQGDILLPVSSAVARQAAPQMPLIQPAQIITYREEPVEYPSIEITPAPLNPVIIAPYENPVEYEPEPEPEAVVNLPIIEAREESSNSNNVAIEDEEMTIRVDPDTITREDEQEPDVEDDFEEDGDSENDLKSESMPVAVTEPEPVLPSRVPEKPPEFRQAVTEPEVIPIVAAPVVSQEKPQVVSGGKVSEIPRAIPRGDSPVVTTSTKRRKSIALLSGIVILIIIAIFAASYYLFFKKDPLIRIAPPTSQPTEISEEQKLFEKGNKDLDEGKLDEAFQAFNKVMQKDPSYPGIEEARKKLVEKLLDSAVKKIDKSDFENALNDLGNAEKLNSDDPKIKDRQAFLYNKWGKALFLQNKQDKAEEYLKKSLSLNSSYGEDISTQLILGQIEFSRGGPESSFARFDQILKKEPDNIDALFFRGRIYCSQKKYKQALADFLNIKKADKDKKYKQMEFWDKYISLFLNKGKNSVKDIISVDELKEKYKIRLDNEENTAFFSLKTEERKRLAGVSYTKGMALMEEKEYSKAVQSLETAIGISPDPIYKKAAAEAYYLLSGEMTRGFDSRSTDEKKRIAGIVRTYLSKASIYNPEKKNDYDVFLKDINRRAETITVVNATKDPKKNLSVEECFNKGKESLDKGDFKTAVDHLRKARLLGRKDKEFYLLLAKAERGVNNPRGAIEAYEALKRNHQGNELIISKGLAEMYFLTGRYEEALSYYQEVEGREPSDTARLMMGKCLEMIYRKTQKELKLGNAKSLYIEVEKSGATDELKKMGKLHKLNLEKGIPNQAVLIKFEED